MTSFDLLINFRIARRDPPTSIQHLVNVPQTDFPVLIRPTSSNAVYSEVDRPLVRDADYAATSVSMYTRGPGGRSPWNPSKFSTASDRPTATTSHPQVDQ